MKRMVTLTIKCEDCGQQEATRRDNRVTKGGIFTVALLCEACKQVSLGLRKAPEEG